MESMKPTRRRPPSRWGSHFALGAAACAIALIAAFGSALRGSGDSIASPSVETAASTVPAAPVAERPVQTASTDTNAQTAATTQPQTSRTTAPRQARLPAQAANGLVVFAVSPWGEVFVNGTLQGTTPPLSQLTLPAGRHTIELRNGQRQPYIAQVDVVPERPLRINHLFQ